MAGKNVTNLYSVKTLLNNFIYTLLGFLAWIYLWVVAITSKTVFYRRDIPFSFIDSGKPFISGLWHNQQFFMSFIARNRNVCALVSQSKDGEYISRALRFFNIQTIRGSSSRDGKRAFVELIRKVRGGNIVAITPDGPRGPVYQVQQGIIQLSKKTGCPVIPTSCALKRKRLFSSWDRYQIPLPFNRIAVVFGEPVYIEKSEDSEEASEKIKKCLDEVTKYGDEMVNKR